MNAPCKDCNKRELRCHSNCPEYLEYCRDNEEKKAFIHQDDIFDNVLYDGTKRCLKNVWQRLGKLR